MARVKDVSRLYLGYTALRVAQETGNKSWFGVKKVFENDERWRLCRSEKIHPDLIMTLCNLSGLSPCTIDKITSLIRAVVQTNNSQMKAVELLVSSKRSSSGKATPTVDNEKIMEIMDEIKNGKGCVSSADAFNIYEQRYGIKVQSKQRNKSIKQLLQSGKCCKSGLRGNNLILLSRTNTSTTSSTTATSSTTTTFTATTPSIPPNVTYDDGDDNDEAWDVPVYSTKITRKNRKCEAVKTYKDCVLCTYRNHSAMNICEICEWPLPLI